MLKVYILSIYIFNFITGYVDGYIFNETCKDSIESRRKDQHDKRIKTNLDFKLHTFFYYTNINCCIIFIYTFPNTLIHYIIGLFKFRNL